MSSDEPAPNRFSRSRRVQFVVDACGWASIISLLCLFTGFGVCANTTSSKYDDLGIFLMLVGVLLGVLSALVVFPTSILDAVLRAQSIREAGEEIVHLLEEHGGGLDSDAMLEKSGWTRDELVIILRSLARRKVIDVIRPDDAPERIVILRHAKSR